MAVWHPPQGCLCLGGVIPPYHVYVSPDPQLFVMNRQNHSCFTGLPVKWLAGAWRRIVYILINILHWFIRTRWLAVNFTMQARGSASDWVSTKQPTGSAVCTNGTRRLYCMGSAPTPQGLLWLHPHLGDGDPHGTYNPHTMSTCLLYAPLFWSGNFS